MRWNGNTAPRYITRTVRPVNIQRPRRVWHWHKCKPLVWLLTAAVLAGWAFIWFAWGCSWRG